MWKCQQCGKDVVETFDVCWYCGTGKDGTPPEDSSVFQEAETMTSYISQTLGDIKCQV
jgi:hypothetical protein